MSIEHALSQLHDLVRYKGTECDCEALQTLKSAVLAQQTNNTGSLQLLWQLAQDHYFDTLEKDREIVLVHIQSLISMAQQQAGA